MTLTAIELRKMQLHGARRALLLSSCGSREPPLCLHILASLILLLPV